MIMTITNNNATTALDVEFRKLIPATTIAAGGGSATFGVTMLDLMAQHEKGNPGWKYLDWLVKKGDVTVGFAADATQQSVVDEANEV